ncbi:MAG: hypothetical protein RSC07_01080 [Mucinivorans sp.]
MRFFVGFITLLFSLSPVVALSAPFAAAESVAVVADSTVSLPGGSQAIVLDSATMSKFMEFMAASKQETVAQSSTTEPSKRLHRVAKQNVFAPRGQWFLGGTLSYTNYKGENFKFLVVEDMALNAILASGRAMVGCCVTNDIAVGLALTYDRTKVQIDELNLKLSEDMAFGIKDFYSIQHTFSASAFLRTYIALDKNRRFGLFNDLRFSFGGGQGKIINGKGEELVGTYQKITKAGIMIQPGISVFVTDFMAVEASIGILGVNYSRTEQITNQVSQGYFENFSADFKLNLLSIGLGITFYF